MRVIKFIATYPAGDYVERQDQYGFFGDDITTEEINSVADEFCYELAAELASTYADFSVYDYSCERDYLDAWEEFVCEYYAEIDVVWVELTPDEYGEAIADEGQRNCL